jgi:ferredoxin
MKTRDEAPVDRGRRDLILGRFLTREGDELMPPRSEPPSVSPGLAVLERSACVAWNGVVCMSCVFSCDDRAIRMDRRGRPAIVEEACTGCAACVDVCPTRAITIPP